jgi:hypothetical protein
MAREIIKQRLTNRYGKSFKNHLSYVAPPDIEIFLLALFRYGKYLRTFRINTCSCEWMFVLICS